MKCWVSAKPTVSLKRIVQFAIVEFCNEEETKQKKKKKKKEES